MSPAAAGPSFALHFRDEVSPFPLIANTCMPGRSFEVEAVLTGRRGRFSARADGGTLARMGAERWRWTAPASPGAHLLCVEEPREGRACLRIFVLVPFQGEDEIEGFRIGPYRDRPGFRGYERPQGLIRVDEREEDVTVSPRFRLSDFLGKQKDGPPRFLMLRTRLLVKLETIADRAEQRGLPGDAMRVMSAYRSPHYNREIGNTTIWSRHGYGDAADVYLDADGDARMDDLDGDGDSDADDARVLYELIESMTRETWYQPLAGGLALYGPAPHRGPFVHVDTRGSAVRW